MNAQSLQDHKGRLPSLFLSHGAPDIVLSDHPATEFLRNLPSRLDKPDGIIVISAHWQTRDQRMTTARMPATIHDFHGFPEALFDMTYPVNTSPALIEKTLQSLQSHQWDIQADNRRGLDHGAWIPLSLLYPEADIPVIQLSLNRRLPPLKHLEFGHALAPLRQQNILIIGSGTSVHNLTMLAPEGTPAPNWATGFDQWLDKTLESKDHHSLAHFETLAPHALNAHPTPEHLLPLLIAAGAGGTNANSRKIHQGYSYGSIGMSAWAFGEYLDQGQR